MFKDPYLVLQYWFRFTEFYQGNGTMISLMMLLVSIFVTQLFKLCILVIIFIGPLYIVSCSCSSLFYLLQY